MSYAPRTRRPWRDDGYAAEPVRFARQVGWATGIVTPRMLGEGWQWSASVCIMAGTQASATGVERTQRRARWRATRAAFILAQLREDRP